MQVAVVQSGGCGPDEADHLAGLADLVRGAAARGAELVVLPELAPSPYFAVAALDPSYAELATAIPGPVTEFFGALCRELGVAIAVGMFERAAETSYNSLVLLDRSGTPVPGRLADGSTLPAYRKLAPATTERPGFTLDEQAYCAFGQGPVVFDLDGWRLGALICYDRAFSEAWLAQRHLGAELVLVAVSSFGWRESLFVDDLRLRAMEMGVYVAAANRAGPETVGATTTNYFGRSCVIAPNGEVLAEAPPHQAGVVCAADVEQSALGPARRDWPVWEDRRPELYGFLRP